MSDERMDERLRDYAARWTEGRPAPSEVPVVRTDRGRSWVPYAAAASVVALVAGIAYAVGPRRDEVAPPVASGSPSVSASPAVRACGEEDVRGDVSLRREPYMAVGALALSAANGPCTIPAAPRVEILGDNLKDVGVTYEFLGTDAPVTLTSTPRKLLLVWNPPFCEETSILVMRVEYGKELGFRLPLDRSVVPDCGTADFGPAGRVLSGRWESRACGPDDWELVSVTAKEDGNGVGVSAVLRNVSTDWCDPNEKPHLRITAPGGKALDLPHMQHSDLRHEPGVPPGHEVRAAVLWRAYCGPEIATYTAALSLREGAIALPLESYPVPPCREDEVDEGHDGSAGTGWLTPLD